MNEQIAHFRSYHLGGDVYILVKDYCLLWCIGAAGCIGVILPGIAGVIVLAWYSVVVCMGRWLATDHHLLVLMDSIWFQKILTILVLLD